MPVKPATHRTIAAAIPQASEVTKEASRRRVGEGRPRDADYLSARMTTFLRLRRRHFTGVQNGRDAATAERHRHLYEPPEPPLRSTEPRPSEPDRDDDSGMVTTATGGAKTQDEPLACG